MSDRVTPRAESVSALFDIGPPTWCVDRDVRECDPETARRWIEGYHYSGCVNSSSRPYAVFAGDLIAVVSIGMATTPAGVAGRYGLERWSGNKEITRVAVHPDAPTNTASSAIAAVCRHISRSGLEWVFSYADTGQGHHGGIYQALNAVYVGTTARRHGWLLDGESTHPRQIVHLFGTESRTRAVEAAEREGRALEFVEGMNAPKHLYILPIGDRRSERAIRRALAVHARTYPKSCGRGAEGSAPRTSVGEVAGSIPADRLQDERAA